MAPFKFNFVPERHLRSGDEGDSTPAFVKLNQAGGLNFNKEIVRLYEMEGRYIKLFGDTQKKAIGWSIVEGDIPLENLKDVHQLKCNKSKAAFVGVSKILKAMGYPRPESTSPRLEVKTYKGNLDTGMIYYILLPDIERPHEANPASEKVTTEDSDAEA